MIPSKPPPATPLRETLRNTSLDPTTRTRNPATSTNPLRISKHESLLTSDDIPNPSFRRIPTQLARRQSSSYNHVKNNSLVSNSPFKRSRIPTPSRATMPRREDENQHDATTYKRRQSRGLIGLAKEQAVTKSPFLGEHKRSNSTTNTETAFTSVPPARPLSCPEPVSVPELNEGRPFTPATPRNNRVTDLTEMPTRSPSLSPKSSLISPKRPHGPRSLSAASESQLRQRRKTVTFDERCDVLEFDRDDISDEAVYSDDAEDFYGLPEPPSPLSYDGSPQASNDNSFSSITSDQTRPVKEYYDEHTPVFQEDRPHDVFENDELHHTPHFSRPNVLEGPTSHYATPEVSFEASLERPLPIEIPPGHAFIDQTMDSPRLDLRLEQNESIDYTDTGSGSGKNIAEMQDALDSFMRGVGSDFGVPLSHEGDSMQADISTDVEMSARLDNSVMSLDTSFDMAGTIELPRQDAESTHISSDGDDAVEPVTPPGKDEFISAEGSGIFSDMEQFLNGTSKLDCGIEREDTHVTEVDLSISGLQSSMRLPTSTPPVSPRKDEQAFEVSHRRPLGPSLSLPPLAFGESCVGENILPSNWALSNTSGFPQSETSLVRSESTRSSDSMPPPVPPKDNAIQKREELIKARRREMREVERPIPYSEGRPTRRRSLSTGDAEDIGSNTPAAQRRVDKLREMTFLDVPIEQENEDLALSDLIDQELRLRRKPTVKEKNRMYKLRERENTIYASSDDKVSHMRQVGDVDTGRAWRTVRRPSDMNEYSRQIREFRQQKTVKAHGKVFVKVLGIRGLNVPIPSQPTAFTCTLNNGIHFVTTPECALARDARIGQEFELIEHSKLEFTLTLKVRRDPHIVAQTKTNAAPSIPVPAPPVPPPPAHRGGVRSFFHVGSSPKKAHKAALAAVPSRATPEPVVNNLARYLKPDGTLAKAFVSFKEIAKRCDTRLFESSFSLIGQKVEGNNGSPIPWTAGEIVLQIFRLPALPGVPADQQPQSLDECLRGLRHIAWHKVIYHEGILTQSGGDCQTWRRRLFRVMGSNLTAFNDVTKKATATIDLKKALAIKDVDQATLPGQPSSAVRDEFDDIYRVERSFRLVFPQGEMIQFFADTDEEKAGWLEVLRALVGHIPPNPLWAELVWQRQEEIATRNGAQAQASIPSQLRPKQAG